MLMKHQSSLPFCCYDKTSNKVILTLVCDNEFTPVKVIYGDPSNYQNTGKLDKMGNEISEWAYKEASIQKLYFGCDSTTWRAEIAPTITMRLKYAFIIKDKFGKSFFYSENGLVEDTPKIRKDHHNYFFVPSMSEADTLDIPAWAGETVWYYIFPERFYNGNPFISPKSVENWETGVPEYDNYFGGDLYGVIEKLPYIKSLGCNGLYLTPIFQSPTNHKYVTQDYFTIDEHFGNKETLRELVAKAHELGMKVMLDAVFNHIGSKNTLWQDVLLNQENSRYKDYFHIRSFPVLETYTNRDDINYETYGFYGAMPKWNTDNPKARNYLIEVALYWIRECDIDGWRLDAADEVSFSFWRDFRKAILDYKKDFYILGEIWVSPSKWLDGGYFDAVMNYQLRREICAFFLGNSPDPDDFTRKTISKFASCSELHGRVQFNILDSHDTVRVLTQANGNKLAMKNAFLFMFLMKGAPCLYYGTEIGMEGEGDPDCRRPMIWDEKKQDLELLSFFKKLIAFRKSYNDLVQNATFSYARNEKICRWTLTHNGEEINIIYNMGNDNAKIDADVLLSVNDNVCDMLPPKSIAVCAKFFS